MRIQKSKHIPRFFIQTLGCKVNQYDSDRLRAKLLRKGYQSASNVDEELDLIVVNTCSVTSESDRKGRQLIRKMIRKHPHARVAVTGCYSERKPNEIMSIDGVSEVVAIEDQEQWVDRISDEMGWGCEDQDGLWEEDQGLEVFQERTRAFVKIQDGCDLKCTFCSIPESRGAARSRPLEDVLRECERLAVQGFPEIVLCGICLGHYGDGENFTLHELVDHLTELPGLSRVRISSLEPQDVSDELYEVLEQKRGIACPHLHLPLQSGANRILRRMKRPYRYEFFKDRVEKGRILLPDFEVTTDIMVGFPGETEEEFEQTLRAVREVRFTKVHSFRFSAREGTPATRMKDALPPAVIEERRRILDQVANETAIQVKQGYIGRTLEVLTETGDEHAYTGFTPNYLRVEFSSPKVLQRGERVWVTIQRVEKGKLMGEYHSPA